MSTPSLTELAAMITSGNTQAAAAPVAEATKTPVQVWREADPVHEQVWQHLMACQDNAGGSGGFGNEFVDSLVSYLNKHGKLTPNQLAAITRQINREPQAPTTPVVTGERVTITGKVVSATERHDPRYRTTLKLTVADDRGFRVYGNAPRALATVMGGDRVTFTATVTASGRDEDFGFFSQAREARTLEDGEQAAASQPPVEQPPVELAELFGDARVLRALSGALGVTIAETDGSPLEHLLYAQLSAAASGDPIPREVELPAYMGGAVVAFGDC